MDRTSRVRGTVVLGTLVGLAACHDATPTAPSGVGSLPTTAQAARSPQAQARLEAIFQRASPEVLALPGTVFADNDEVAGRLVFGVENEAAARGVQQALARLGVQEADFAVEVTQPIHQMITLRDKFDPTRAGIQVHFGQYVCTMGFNIAGGTKGTQSYGRSFVTNSHCTNTQGGTEGTVYYQPSSSTSGVIATEADDPTYFKGSACPRGKKCRYSDASRALYAGSAASNGGEIARTTGVNSGSLTVDNANPFFGISGVANGASVGAVVNKVGRTTGWTQGTVTRTCVNTAVSGSQVMQLCQTWVQHSSATIVSGGDSGSGVFTLGSNGATLVGILWGGSSDNRTFIFSPYGQIQQELGSFTGVTK